MRDFTDYGDWFQGTQEYCPECDEDGVLDYDVINLRPIQKIRVWCESCGWEKTFQVVMNIKVVQPKKRPKHNEKTE